MPRRYEVIPYDIEAIQITPESVQRAAIWCGGYEATEIDPLDLTVKFAAINVPTLHEIKRASEGSYITKDKYGRFDVVDREEFESKFRLI